MPTGTLKRGLKTAVLHWFWGSTWWHVERPPVDSNFFTDLFGPSWACDCAPSPFQGAGPILERFQVERSHFRFAIRPTSNRSKIGPNPWNGLGAQSGAQLGQNKSVKKLESTGGPFRCLLADPQKQCKTPVFALFLGYLWACNSTLNHRKIVKIKISQDYISFFLRLENF